MKTVLVIGGGFAGLSAATALADKGCAVTVLEGRQVLGGRAYSFTDPQTGDSVDNGQHLFMGCYHETLRFLDRIGTRDRLRFQKNLSVDFVAGGGRSAKLRCWPLPSPWHLLSGLLRLSTLSWADRLRLTFIPRALREYLRDKSALDPLTVTEWLRQWRQSDQARRHLWDLIAIATLNEDPHRASAGPFAEVLQRAFFSGRQESLLGLASVGLSDLYVPAACAFLEQRGGHVRLKSPVDHLDLERNRVTAVHLRDGQELSADWVISAVPAAALLKILPKDTVETSPAFQALKDLPMAPIISIHLWFDRAISRKRFAGLLDTHIQWFFNKSKIHAEPKTEKGYVSLVISGAHAFTEWPESDLLAMALEELRRLFPRAREAVLLRSLVIKEHQATLSPGVGCEERRPTSRTPFSNFLLAGDWTRTGLPATIESACISGHACAQIILESPASPERAKPSREIARV